MSFQEPENYSGRQEQEATTVLGEPFICAVKSYITRKSAKEIGFKD
jgi:hypothetical protein